MILTIPKVLAYVTHASRPGQILVFEQPDFPEAGLQVPAGTVEPDETPEAAVLRETAEETGLQQLSIEKFLGETAYDMSEFKPEIHHRYFFHVVCRETPFQRAGRR